MPGRPGQDSLVASTRAPTEPLWPYKASHRARAMTIEHGVPNTVEETS